MDLWRWFDEWTEGWRGNLFYAAMLALFALIRATGVTIESGQRGLRFTFGRAGRVLEPGFHMLVPFLQKVRRLPSRSRTIDLAAQQVTTLDGFVYKVDANLVYRVADLRLALVEVDRLEVGILQMCALGVHEVMRDLDADSVRAADSLDVRLREILARRLLPWGVEVERAGFGSITPTEKTLRLTQLARLTNTRRAMLERLERALPHGAALALLGTRTRCYPRSLVARSREEHSRRRRAWTAALLAQGLSRAQASAPMSRRVPASAGPSGGL